MFLETEITSDTVTISGFDDSVAISVSGGEYSIDGGTYTSDAGVLTEGQTVALRATSSEDLNTTVTVTLTVSDVSENFTLTTRSAEPSGLFEGTGTVNSGTPLSNVKVMIRNESFIMFDETENVLYDGDIVSYEGNNFNAEFDVYKDGQLVAGDKVSATGTIDSQNSIAFTLSGTDYGSGTISADYNEAFTETPATNYRFSAEAIPSLNVWVGSTNTITHGNHISLRAPDAPDDNTFTLGTNLCNYGSTSNPGIKTFPEDTLYNLYDLDFDSEQAASALCDHDGIDYKGFATVLDDSSVTGKDSSGTAGIMWFAATNGTYSTFTVFTYQ